MKFLNISLLILAAFLFSACPGMRYEDSTDKLLKNKMDLPNPVKRHHDGINYMLSDLFENSYLTDYVLKDNATVKIIYDLNLNFSVESFTRIEAESFRFNFSEDTDLLNAVHDHYAFCRQKSLNSYFTSIKKPVDKRVGFKGYTQTIQGSTEYNESDLLYLMATLEIGDKFYVFQLIGKKDNMGYLKDDFSDILNSVEK